MIQSQLQNFPIPQNRPFDASCHHSSSPTLLGGHSSEWHEPASWLWQEASKSSIFQVRKVLQLALQLFFAFLPALLFGTIIESNSLAILETYADASTLVLCDVDNTLIESALHMGSAQWRGYIREKSRKMGCSEERVEAILDKFWIFSQFFVPVRCVDPSTCQVLSNLQQSQIPVLALTAREPIEAFHTQKQFRSVGIDLGSQEDSFALPLPHPCLCENGVIYCGNNEKSDALIAFFQKTNHFPDRIVFLDDRLEQVQAVENGLQELGIDVIGIHFTEALRILLIEVLT